MSDIVERLREYAATSSYLTESRPRGMINEAADEIEKLREALQGLVSDLDDYPAVARLLDTYEYARAALKGKGDE